MSGSNCRAWRPMCSRASCGGTRARPRRASNISCSARWASGILLYGISLVYGFSGTTLFSSISTAYGAGHSLGLTFGLVFVFAGLAFKISAVPFHMWTPDVYEGAPTPVTAFFRVCPESRRDRFVGARRGRGNGAGDRSVAADRDLRIARLDHLRRGRGDRAKQHQAAAGLFVDQQCRLRARRARGGNARGGSRRRSSISPSTS